MAVPDFVKLKWDSLDLDAKTNLSTTKYLQYKEYKERLKSLWCPWEDARDYLVGFIWDNIEEDEDG